MGSIELCLSLVNRRPWDVPGGAAVATEPKGRVWFCREGPRKSGQMARSTDRAVVCQKPSLLRPVRNNPSARFSYENIQISGKRVIYKDYTGSFMLIITSIPESSDAQYPITNVWLLLGGKWRCTLAW